ncbi:DUF3616 domain-containing protein [Sphingomonas sp. LY54]|uniref:DUF3616 domain-containing protein n=1 Tax=Sphingomonas sp. LY54 TaxID=3095343 RepID=UPI002D79C174|nr:DUF3616 domain-containing protein [Sphingomonas sp. LY54]WRP28239.1 DUF3616 domain-containing protein [Sphingomonas sp. LY54]
MCEASAALDAGAGTIAVADDDSYSLHLYRLGDHSPAGTVPLTAFLGGDPEEAPDIEGATRIGDTGFWITSHSLTKKANVKRERLKLFRTRLSAGPGAAAVPVGRAYDGLREDLLEAMKGSEWALEDAATRTPETGLTKDELPPKAEKGQDAAPAQPAFSAEAMRRHAEGGFNIEGLAAGPGDTLLLGFRSPVRLGKALVVPLLNGPEITAGVARGASVPKAKFGAAMGVDLGGLGIRSIARMPGSDDYLIAAGPVGDGGTFRLYRWHLGDKAGVYLRDLPAGLIGEAMLMPSTTPGQLLVLSDDGDRKGCKDKPRFRSALIPLAGLKGPTKPQE